MRATLDLTVVFFGADLVMTGFLRVFYFIFGADLEAKAVGADFFTAGFTFGLAATCLTGAFLVPTDTDFAFTTAFFAGYGFLTPANFGTDFAYFGLTANFFSGFLATIFFFGTASLSASELISDESYINSGASEFAEFLLIFDFFRETI